MTLRWRIASVVAVLVLLLCAVAAVAIREADQRGQLYEQLETVIEPARQDTAEALEAVDRAEGGLRGYVRTGDLSFLQSYTSGLSAADEVFARLRDHLEGKRELLRAVGAAEASVSQWNEEVARPQLRSAGRTDQASEARVSGPPSVEADRDDLRALAGQLNERRTEILVDLQAAQQRLLFTIVGAAVAAVVLAGGFMWLLHRWISRPIEDASEAIDTVVAGSLNAEIPRRGPRELAALGANVDHMRRRLVEQLDEAHRARQGLEQHGPAVVSLRATLTPPTRALPGWVMASAAFAPARGVLAGDWYDVLVLDDDRVAVAVMDVSGHGPSAGVLALRAKEQLSAALRGGQAPGQALASVAANLGDTGEQFLTCFVAEVSRDGACRYASAGHPPAVLSTPAGIHHLEPSGPLMGPLEASWETEAFELGEGGSLLLYTDGLLEARNEDRELFDPNRLDELVEAQRQATPAELVSTLAGTLAAFTGGTFGDDVTVVALSRQRVESDAEQPSYVQTFPVADVGPVEGVDPSRLSESQAQA